MGVVRICACLCSVLLSNCSLGSLVLHTLLIAAAARRSSFPCDLVPSSPDHSVFSTEAISRSLRYHLQRRVIIYFCNVAKCDGGRILGRVQFICTATVHVNARRRDHRPPELSCWSSYCEKTTRGPELRMKGVVVVRNITRHCCILSYTTIYQYECPPYCSDRSCCLQSQRTQAWVCKCMHVGFYVIRRIHIRRITPCVDPRIPGPMNERQHQGRS